MMRWLMALCLVGLLVYSPVAQAFSIAGTVTGGQSGILNLKYVIAVPMRLDTANLLRFATFVNPLNSQYTLSGLDSGMYLLFSYQDLNHNILPDLDEPRGFWNPDTSAFLPAIMSLVSDTSHIHIQLSPPNAGGFTGTITYAGEHRGMTYIQAFNTATFDSIHGGGLILDTTQTGNGNYTAITDTFGTYYAYAFMDLNANFQPDPDEPFGIYGGTTPAAIHIQQTNFPSGIDITMLDPNAAPAPGNITPLKAGLSSVYPNPFNNSTTVTFTVGSNAPVALSLFDVLGREVKVLAKGSFSPGEHRLAVDGSGLSTGIYFVRLTSPDVQATRAVLLLK